MGCLLDLRMKTIIGGLREQRPFQHVEPLLLLRQWFLLDEANGGSRG